MNAGELADKLEARWADSNSSEEDEIIVKSLRFAADMERLAGEDVIFTKMAGEMWLEGWSFSVTGSDIYTAARNAVEQLEGKSQ